MTGILGGFVSSTATTWFFSRQSGKREQGGVIESAAIILASSIMFPRLLIWLLLLNVSLFRDLWLPVTLLGVGGIGLGTGSPATGVIRLQKVRLKKSATRSICGGAFLCGHLPRYSIYRGLFKRAFWRKRRLHRFRHFGYHRYRCHHHFHGQFRQRRDERISGGYGHSHCRLSQYAGQIPLLPGLWQPLT
ncbi:MAG: DUF4010 domain-containing protein [Saprospirales bacterium]|nr:DUF4010 domain-containing protein [Saprospirales bacterium]